MSSTVDPQVDEDEFDEEEPGLWGSFGTALRLIVGWFCVAIGVLNLLVEVDRTSADPPDAPYFVFHSMLFVGGITLLAVSWLGRRPGLPGYLAGGLVMAGGMIVSGLPVTNSVCCLSAYDIRHGWPFSFVARDDGLGEAARWHIDSQHLLADLLFWGYVGLIALVIVASVRRAATPEPEPEPMRHAAADHAEQRALAEEQPTGDARHSAT